MRRILIVGVLLGLIIASASTGSWFPPEPTGYISRGMNYVAEIFPPLQAVDSSYKPLCYFYSTGYESSFELLWKDTLINEACPIHAIISMGGDLVTFNNHGRDDFEHSVVIYDKQGHLVKTYNLYDIMPEEDTLTLLQTRSYRWWNTDATYFFANPDHMREQLSPTHLYIKLQGDKAMEFRLKDGAFRHGSPTDFEVLDSLLRQGNRPNERTAIMGTSLRFSSITQLLDCRRQLKQ